MTKAFICGLAGTALTDEERAFLRETLPWGVILFRRNVETREQLRALADLSATPSTTPERQFLSTKREGAYSVWLRRIGGPIPPPRPSCAHPRPSRRRNASCGLARG